jgi:hypothetical protein
VNNFTHFLKKVLSSENFKEECKIDPVEKLKYNKYRKQYDKEKLKLEFLLMYKK